jgi:UDP-N-acetyl-D-mannosaminuronate dehydrogenase
MVPTLEKSGLKLDRDYFTCLSPEPEDPANRDYWNETIPKVVGATSRREVTVAERLYQLAAVSTVPVSSARAVEATILLQNTFRVVNMTLINEMKIAFMRMGIHFWEVIGAAKTKPFGAVNRNVWHKTHPPS